MSDIFEKALENDIVFLKENLNQINETDDRGKSLLYYAVLGNSYECIDLLLLNSISPNVKDKSGETPIFDCARKAKLKIAKILINHGALINVENKKGETPLHLSCHKGDSDFIRLLVENGAKLNSKTPDGKLPIHYAILGGNQGCLDYLVSKGKESWLQKDFQGNSLLHYGARTNNHALILYLLTKDLNPNTLNDQFETPLFNAVRYGTKETINALLLNGALVNIKNRRYETPFDIALIYGNEDNFNYLSDRIQEPNLEKHESEQSLTLAVLNRDHIELRKLIEKNVPMKKDKLHKTALDYAKEYKQETCISLLKDY